jgi:hypothetical protein
MLLHVPDKPVVIDSDGRASYGEVIRLTENRALAIDDTDLDNLQINLQARLHFGEIEVVIECPPGTSGDLAEWTNK